MNRISGCLVVCFTLIYSSVFSTHLRAGEIVVTQSVCGQRSYSIVLILYGDLSSTITPGGDPSVLNLGDGRTIPVPEGAFHTRPDLPAGVGVFTYSIEHVYLQDGTYSISYMEPNRNGGIVNIGSSDATPFYIETIVAVGSMLCNSLPVLLAPPVDRACSGRAFFHNPAAFDEDGDSLVFRFVVPLSSSNQPVSNYRDPNHPGFYINPPLGNEAGTGPAAFIIHSSEGTITWDAPGAIGQYNIAFVVEEWRKIDSVFVRIGVVRRDMQIIVEDCNNNRPDLVVPENICVLAGTSISEIVLGTDPDGHDVKIEVFSGIFSLPNNPAVFSPDPPVFQSSTPSAASLSFNWTPSCEEVRNQPYQIIVKITDNPLSETPLVRFKTWSIKVLAEAPNFSSAELDILQRQVNIAWSPYVCSNATAIQVWRRVGSFPYNPECVSGLPKFAGYTKIGEALPNELGFTDTNDGNGLAPGAVYCYRLTAVFPLAGGAESRVSVEICLPPILAEAPVITHVTVDKTTEDDGEVTVSWRSPYDRDQSQYVGAYEYVLFRARGLTGEEDITPVQLANILDTTFTDKGLNTLNFAYSYRIVLMARQSVGAPVIPIDTSAVASSVWNGLTPAAGSIELRWDAVTPWSNVSQDYPWHLIYRSSETDGYENLVLIDSVNVSENNFLYVDDGSFQNLGLDEHEYYCYRVKTRGTYGNLAIAAPQENYSQLICSTTLDVTVPCIPKLNQANLDCDLFNSQTPCSQTAFAHTINWNSIGDQMCLDDIYFYHVYASNNGNDVFELIGLTHGNEFTESGLTSLKRCYKITSVDRAGNESGFSETICFDNCPSISFPNVFTPNDDSFNEHFENFNNDQACLRFVKSVSLSVFNRWGNKVIELDNKAPIAWDGRDSKGNMVSSGIYFFKADVLVDVLDSHDQRRQFKGWIHIVH